MCGPEEVWFQSHILAYKEIMWYFAFLAMVNFLFALAAIIEVDVVATGGLAKTLQHTCGHLNFFLISFSVAALSEGIISGLLSVTIQRWQLSSGTGSSTIRKGWALMVLGVIVLWCFSLLFKLAVLALGVLSTWSEEGEICMKDTTANLYSECNRFLIAVIVLASCQLILGTFYLSMYGLDDLTREAVLVWNYKDDTPQDDLENLLDEGDGDA
eukprot:gb/GEZN01016221.1/.p1 GENE.gb/GEZN01016221.1/~~gb/GEZN01016221.1/.p1  ORF type:complete len:213 (+),score=21.54 gb/GEZN01016221.1/:79-717(+)